MDYYNKYKEWFLQSDYDFETAIDMQKAGRNIYCVFLCHLSIEKALKGLFIRRKNEFPSKTHNLLYIIEKLDLKLSDLHYDFIFTIDKISIPTRYPEDLNKLSSHYTKQKTQDILNITKEIQTWIKQQ